MEYRYMIWNDVQKEFQFPRICETTEKEASICLFKYIGNEAKKIVKKLKQKYKAERIHAIIPNIDIKIILELVKINDLGGE